MTRIMLRTLSSPLLALILLFTLNARSQQVVSEAGKLDPAESQELQDFKARVQAANPGMNIISVEADVVKRAVLAPPAPVDIPKIAVFVKNQTRVPGMDEEVDGIRDRIGAELAGEGLIVMDQTEIIDGFNRYKTLTAEERAGLIEGVFTGGSTVQVAQMLGCQYILIAKIIRASHLERTAGDRPVTVYTLNMSTKVNEATRGSSVFGANWSRKVPVPGGFTDNGEAMSYYNDLLDQWVRETAADIQEKAPAWRKPAATADRVSFSVSSTVDELIQGLESGVRAPNELLDEMRRLVGGVTVELDGAAIGSSPGTFKTTPGMHQLKVTRAWMTPWQKTVNIQEGTNFRVALELSDAGLQRFSTLESFRSMIAVSYAEAAMRKGVKVNFDTAAWQQVTTGDQNSGNVIQNNVDN